MRIRLMLATVFCFAVGALALKARVPVGEAVVVIALPAIWIAGVAVAVITGAGLGLRLIVAGDWQKSCGCRTRLSSR